MEPNCHEEEFELLNIMVSLVKVKAEYTPGAIRIGMRDLMGESKQKPQPTDIDIDPEQMK